MKRIIAATAAPCLLLSLSGCSDLSDRMAGIPAIYAVTAAISLLLLLGYCLLLRKRDLWFLLLFGAVTVVNTGYLLLSLSTSLEGALWANRVAYLGSVFLPVTMLMIILHTCRLPYKKWLSYLLLGIGALVFLVAASPGYLDIYYKEVSFQVVNGVATLVKDYGPWHKLYLFYLLAYFVAMISAIIHASRSKRIASNKYAIVLLIAVLVNIGVWLLEQLVKVDFEFLSVSYIISELFLLALNLMLQELELLQTQEKEEPSLPEPEKASAAAEAAALPQELLPQREYFAQQLKRLTPTERLIYDLYLREKTTKEIMKELNIKENTLKYHNKNIYGKLGVRSRKQLCEIAQTLEPEEK